MSAEPVTTNTWPRMNSNNPAPQSLVKLATGALVTAALALVLFVLPAEFDIDPTGLGESMGTGGCPAIKWVRLRPNPGCLSRPVILLACAIRVR